MAFHSVASELPAVAEHPSSNVSREAEERELCRYNDGLSCHREQDCQTLAHAYQSRSSGDDTVSCSPRADVIEVGANDAR